MIGCRWNYVAVDLSKLRSFGAWTTFATMAALVTSGSVAEPLGAEIRHLLQTSPRLKVDMQELQAARHEIDAARADFLPTGSLRGEVGPKYIDTPWSRSGRREEGRHSTFQRTAGLEVRQRLFDGDRRSANLAAARSAERLAAFNLRFTAQNLVFRACLAYLDVVRQGELASLATEHRLVLQTQLGLEDERVSRGSGVAVDVLLAKTRLQLASERLVAFEGALNAARARYARVFGHAPAAAGITRPKLPEMTLPKTLEDALEVAASENLRLSIAAEEVRLVEERRRSAASASRPKLDLAGAYVYEEDADYLPGRGDEYSILLTTTWDFFSIFRARSQVAALAARRNRARFDAEDVRRRVTEDVTRAFEAFETAKRRVELLRNATSIAEEVFDARVKLRQAGSETAINVLNARSETFNARIKLVDAEFDAVTALLTLMLTTGTFGPEILGEDAPPEFTNLFR